MPDVHGAVARLGMGRLVFALSDDQLQQLMPPGAVGPDAAHVAYEGPAATRLRVPIEG